ncbi:antichymotrypsin-2-like isoform X2 [Chelonus insularis]|uniref:antichymotrypsin-2-like isoform X2 n=1 Tax=Chelonus insularis TaxID=460826 RepID=UPI00158DD83C|nr:antichymotrypsin-2-like isoform X2 [Chelonus insularis]
MNEQILYRICVIFAVVSIINAASLDSQILEDFKSLMDVSRSINQFSNKFYEALSKDESKNIITSPLSAAMVLRMVAYGARGKTSNELSSILHFNIDDESQKRGVQNLITELNDVKNVNLTLANKVFLAKGLKVNPEYLRITETIFHSVTETVDFTNSLAASNSINNWCERQTHSHIKDIVKPDDFDAATALVLVNAVYFKGNWLNKFNKNETQLRNFYVDSQTVKKVPMMHRLGSYRYGFLPEVDARFIELPYESSDDSDLLKMVIILPNNIDGLPKVEASLHKFNLYQYLSGEFHEVDLFMPKFKIESSMDLKDPLEAMGLIEIFRDTADFTGIVDSPPLKVGKVIQKAFIEVNEEGSEATVATVSDLQNRVGDEDSIKQTVNFIVDKPFIMLITNINTIIFNGRYTV